MPARPPSSPVQLSESSYTLKMPRHTIILTGTPQNVPSSSQRLTVMSQARSKTVIKGLALIWNQRVDVTRVDEVRANKAEARRRPLPGSPIGPLSVTLLSRRHACSFGLIGWRTGSLAGFDAEPGGLTWLACWQATGLLACQTWKHPVRAEKAWSSSLETYNLASWKMQHCEMDL